MQLICLESNGAQLIGSMHPGEKNEAIIIYHGYMSASRIGPYRLYFLLANELQQLGYNVYRFDCSGCGESLAYFDVTEATFMKNAYDITDYVLDKGYKKVHVIGHCFGASVALEIHRRYQTIDKAIAISTVPINSSQMTRLLSPQQMALLKTQSFIERKSLLIHRSFFEGIALETELKKQLSVRPQEILLCNPDEDAYVEKGLLNHIAINARVAYKNYIDADHHFLTIRSRKALYNDVCTFINEDNNRLTTH